MLAALGFWFYEDDIVKAANDLEHVVFHESVYRGIFRMVINGGIVELGDVCLKG
jgi:hypothetical protein